MDRKNKKRFFLVAVLLSQLFVFFVFVFFFFVFLVFSRKLPKASSSVPCLGQKSSELLVFFKFSFKFFSVHFEQNTRECDLPQKTLQTFRKKVKNIIFLLKAT
jgi:hypothetical protein